MKFIRWIAKLDSKRRVVIPINACRELGITPRQEIEIIKRGGKLIISNSNLSKESAEVRKISRNMKELLTQKD